MYAIRKSAQISQVMKEYNIDTLRISDCRWKDTGKIKLATGETFICEEMMTQTEEVWQ